MADIFDAVLHTAATIAAAHGGKPRQPKPYPRPGARDRRSMGGGAIPVSAAPAPAMPAPRRDAVGRNDPCPCGSGKKYKKCCGRNIA